MRSQDTGSMLLMLHGPRPAVDRAAQVLWLVAAILVIHAVEAYMLNPLSYGRHLRLHPLAVLVILIIVEKVFGVWDLLLGVPVAAFVLEYVEGKPVVPVKVPAPDPPP